MNFETAAGAGLGAMAADVTVDAAAGTGTVAGFAVSADTALAVTAAANAGISTLMTQASISLINNKGDLGKTLQELGSLDTVKNIAIAMAAAGALSEVGSATDGHFSSVTNPDGTTSYVNAHGITVTGITVTVH